MVILPCLDLSTFKAKRIYSYEHTTLQIRPKIAYLVQAFQQRLSDRTNTISSAPTNLPIVIIFQLYFQLQSKFPAQFIYFGLNYNHFLKARPSAAQYTSNYLYSRCFRKLSPKTKQK